MKKIYSFILAAVLCCTSNVWAGELTVADGTKSNNCVPYDGYSGDYFQRVQIIYPQSELAAMAGKDITSLTFYVNSQAPSALGVKVQIGLAEISDSDFSAGKDYKSATLTIVKAEDVWDLNAETVVVEFSEPFSYSGEGNILFDLQTVAKGGYGNTSFYGVGSLANYQSAYSYNESSIPATSSNRYKFIPKTTFTYEEPAPTPVGPVADLSKDIEIDLRGQQLGGDSETGGSKYLIIDSEDNYTYVDDEPAAYNAHFAFDNFNGTQHGYTNLLVTAPVTAGKYRLTLGTCQYGTGTGNVKNASSEILAEFDQKTAACYNGNPAQNTVSVIFTVDAAQTITIDCGNWTPYMKLEAVTAYQVSFALGDAEGTAPTAVDVTIGENITMPVNKTMYKAGYTLTGWSDGVNTYPIGESFTPANDVVLTPVFTANQADLLNASSDVTVKWNFGGDNGAPTTSYEGTSGLLVAQATIGDKKVDVKLSIDATSDKFAPQATTEWAQVNKGTIFTYPYKEGMTVNVDNYKSYVTYYIADAEGKVVCYYENDYYSFIEVTYPASQPTAVENVQTNHVQATKFFRDGQLLIEKNGHIINVQGQPVR